MGTIAIIISVLTIIVAIVLVGLVISQEGNSQGLGSSIQGGSDTFFGNSQSKTKDQILKRLTAIFAILFAVLTIILYLITK
ncbi:MAG: preprotein translocase subunit SecG [Clostridiaceae bacterium]|nr:preprotein translocase subunit SecG [Clostridiaceae bacterium]